jgi:hypothetical protein
MFKGPLGLWPFPILNLLQELVQQKGEQTFQPAQPAMRNLETIKWTDWKGRTRVVEVHREVETSG